MTVVPYEQLRPETLDALIEEFVSREGAVHGHEDTPMPRMIESVKRQLRASLVVIVFDDQSESCTIVPAKSLDRPMSEASSREVVLDRDDHLDDTNLI
jgi:uncharacterized protein YheU (UPF0270 family)